MKKQIATLILSLFCLSVFSQQFRYRNTALDTTPQLVNLSYTNMSSLNIAYAGTTIIYVKFYDTKNKPKVSTDHPVLTYQLSNSVLTRPPQFQEYNGRAYFKNGLWIRCSTGITDTSTAQPANKPLIEITY